MTNLAVIDLGSNSVRLRITQLANSGQYKVLAYEKEYVRLSANMGSEKLLKPEPIARTIKALKRFKKICQKFSDVQLISVATAAVRQATNQDEFLAQVVRETGLQINVISGEREAYLDYVGVSRTLPIRNGLILDTGGASMELILVDDGYAEEAVSLPVGSVLLSQRYQLGDQITAANLYDAVVQVDELLASQRWLNRARHSRIVALGGSNRALAKAYRWQHFADSATVPSVHGLTMTRTDAYTMMHQLISLTREERAAMHGIASARADVIVGGLLPLMTLLRQLNLKQLMFSNNGLREGLMFKYMDHKLSTESIQHLQKA